jgi:hypothetical protein
MVQLRPGHQVFLKSPEQAVKTVWPKQRHTFMVKFYPNGTQVGADQTNNQALTYVARMAERPKINVKAEELHQYNKKRQVYTGFKLDPLRVQFYDDVMNTAMLMWQKYAQYYFGDFQNVGTSYNSDAVSQTFLDVNKTGFGLLANKGSNNVVNDLQSSFYFSAIEIYHFYFNMYDAYQFINPRIVTFDPDDMDYENSTPALISMSFVYENLQYVLQQNVASGNTQGENFAEFAAGAPFDGDVMKLPTNSQGKPDMSTTPWWYQSGNTPVNSLFASAEGALSNPADYRYNGAPATGALGMYGNFQFGPYSQASLSNMALRSSGLAAALDFGRRVDPLTVIKHSLQGMVNTAIMRGLNGAQWDVAVGRMQPMFSGYGNAGGTVAGAMLATGGGTGVPLTPAQQELQNIYYSMNPNETPPPGVVLSPEAYGTINAGQTGTAQWGYSNGGVTTITSSGFGSADL